MKISRRRPRRPRRRPQQDAGFMLLEIIIAVALIGLIAAAVATGVMHTLEEGRKRTARLQVREVMHTVTTAMLDDNACPTLSELVSRNAFRNEPKDPWGTPLVLHCPSQHEKDPVDVISLGPDKKEGTDDDINSWRL